MASVQVNLRSDYKGKKGKKESQIQLVIYTGEATQTKIGIDVKVNHENWDAINQQVIFKVGGKYTKKEVKDLNQFINIELKELNLIITSFRLQGKTLSGKLIRDEYKRLVGKKRNRTSDEELLLIPISKLYKPFSEKYGYRSGHRTTFSSYQEYEKEKGRFTLNDISYAFMKNYVTWLEAKGKTDGTIDLRVRMLKAFFNSEIKPIYKGVDFSYSDYNYEILEKAVIRLTIQEFHKFFLIKDPVPERQLKIDWFILITSTGGYRISSARKLTHKSFDKKERTVTYVERKVKGGTKDIVNPLCQYALDILEKYNWKMPKLMADSNYNEGLIDIAKKNGFNRIITEDKKIGGKNVTTETPLHDYFTSKMSRKTFTSICSDLNISRIISNAMSNHSNRSGNASDSYRDNTDINLLEHKRKEMEKWDEMYRKFNEPDMLEIIKAQLKNINDNDKIEEIDLPH